ncbi:MAG: hypothetical protein NWQ54_19035 [Paraglaciecola sp.]|uniref:hypothetical protein n=1 Tax=Pseudomonadati TaxID=3379134 RepID=UPI00273E5AC8|nr:hypothetical protein [Paraglaciecola sp.]MDP5029391.1 hypothetical protein [Paraglaciecola sp.]MDP5132979.1 hypothetical protein [Paraglaciecola sp.]
MYLRLGLVMLLLTAIVGCDGLEKKQGMGKYGMMDPNLPEYTAIEFFDHMFHDDDLTEALKLSSPTLKRLISSYHTNRNAQRHVLNLRFDKVKITPHTGSAGRNEFSKESKVIIFFEGELNGKILKDMRVVDLIRDGKEWKVDKISIK